MNSDNNSVIKRRHRVRVPHLTIALVLVFILTLLGIAQTPIPPSGGRGVLRLKARVRVGETNKNLPRKRFYLIKGTAEQNKSWIQMLARAAVSRDCYYRQQGASEGLIKWLKENDCESVYCREVQLKDVEGPESVPEFQRAVDAGEREFKSRDIARKWATTQLPDNLRDGFYRANQQRLQQLLSEAEKVSGSKPLSVMTDRLGTAYFTDLEPGTYVLSNMLPTEVGTMSVSWSCELQVKVGDIATEKPFMISNRQERNVKCVGTETPLPACE